MSTNLFAHAMHLIGQWRVRRKTIGELKQLDNHMLDDIGLDRWAIESTVDEVMRSRDEAFQLNLRPSFGTSYGKAKFATGRGLRHA